VTAPTTSQSTGHVPSELCPHRWCPFAHRARAWVAAVALLALVLTLNGAREWLVLGLLGLTACSTLMALLTSRRRKAGDTSLADSIAAEQQAVPVTRIARGWARAAVLYDIVLLLAFTAMAIWIPSTTFSLAPPEDAHRAKTVALTLPMVLAAAVGLLVLGRLLHRRAINAAEDKPGLGDGRGGAASRCP
jgi:hypothetical protein